MKATPRYAQPDLGMWFAVTVILGLAPLSLAIGGHYLLDSVQIERGLRCGILVFYAYALAARVMREKLGALWRFWIQSDRRDSRHVTFLRQFSYVGNRTWVPSIVAVLSLLCCWRVVGKSASAPDVMYMSLAAAFLAILSSLEHCMWVRLLLRRRAEGTEAGEGSGDSARGALGE